MALTYEEKVEKLKNDPKWVTFTDPQRAFLMEMASSNGELIKSYATAYPNTKQTGLIFAAQNLVQMVGIKHALAGIDWVQEKAVVSRKEALGLLSKHLRKQEIDPATLVKLLTIYSKMMGWDKDKDKESDEPVSMDKLVTALEKKRRNRSEEGVTP